MLPTQFRGILKDKTLVLPKSGRDMIIEEKKVMKVEVTQMPSDVTVINMRKVGHLPGVNDGELTQICDYLLISKSEGMDHAIFIELKKTLRENKKGMDQLRRSLPILDYLRSMCQIHYGVMTNRSALKVRYFLIGTKNDPRIDKQRVRPQIDVEKENYEDIEVHTFLGERIQFDLLLNGEMDT